MIVSGRLKGCLPNAPLNYELSFEGNSFVADETATYLTNPHCLNTSNPAENQ